MRNARFVDDLLQPKRHALPTGDPQGEYIKLSLETAARRVSADGLARRQILSRQY